MDLCICEFDDAFDEQPRLGLWLLHIQPERLGNASSGLSRHWETTNSDRIRNRYEELLRRQRIQEEARERQRQFERRRRMAEQEEDEEYEERERRQRGFPLGDLLWVAGAHVPAPRYELGQRYEHRLALWDHHWFDQWNFIAVMDDWGGDSWVDRRWVDDLSSTDFDSYFDLDDYSDSGELTQRSRRRYSHGAPKRMQTVKAWAPRRPDGASGMEHKGASNQRATPHRQKVLAVSHPRRQRNAAPVNALAQQRREIALARRLREMQRSQHRQSAAIRRIVR